MEVKWFQVEATTKCNAWCPGCARNINGYELHPELSIIDLDPLVLENYLSQCTGLEVVDFCGTYGDAIAAANIETLTSIAKRYADKVVVRTNGSIRNRDWWKEYAVLLGDHRHEIWFCLDGLADTHAVYRQGTDFDTIISNAQTFMQNGGTAVWQFIPWQHNEHQIKDCIRLSQQLGFSRFEFVKNVRTDFHARHYRTGEPVKIVPWQENLKFNSLEKIKLSVPIENCRHLSQPSLYLNANGTISNCCFFNTRTSATNIKELPNIKEELISTPRPECLKYCGI